MVPTVGILYEKERDMRVAKKQDMRLNEILDTAEALFAEKGYETAAVNDILSLCRKTLARQSMSKYEPLWEYLQADGSQTLTLIFDKIKSVLGFEIDHSFLTYKKEAGQYGYLVGTISLKEKHIAFNNLDAAQ
jgi:hypothetical protein